MYRISRCRYSVTGVGLRDTSKEHPRQESQDEDECVPYGGVETTPQDTPPFPTILEFLCEGYRQLAADASQCQQ